MISPMSTSRLLEIAVLLCGDALALVLAVLVVRPGTAQGILWVLGGVACLAVTGLYAHHLRRSPLDDFPLVLLGSAAGMAAMSLSGPAGLRHAVTATLLGGLLVALARMGTYTVLGRWWRLRRLFDP